MILITGGASQGKRHYAETVLGCSSITDGAVCELRTDEVHGCICNYELLVKRLMNEGMSPDDFTKELCRHSPDAVVIIREIGCGIVPLDREDRLWREAVGRCGCILAECSKTVVRLICGIPSAIKGVLP